MTAKPVCCKFVLGVQSTLYHFHQPENEAEHAEGNIAVLDCVREVKPSYSPQNVVSEFARTLKSYGVLTVEGDGYSGQFVRELFRNGSGANGKSGAYSPRTHLLRKRTRMLSMDDLFKGRQFDREIIILCVRWYLRFKLSFRDLVEMMAERGISLAHTTIIDL